MPRMALSEIELHTVRARATEAAKRLFAAGGFEAMSFRRIAAEIGFSKSGLYRYFPRGKDEILAAIRVQAFEVLIERHWRAYAAAANPLQALRLLGDAFVQFADDHPINFKLVFVFAHGDWESFDELTDQIGRAWEPLERTFQDAIEEELLEGDPQVLARAFYAAMLGVMTVYLSDEDDPLLSVECLRESLLGLLVRGATPAGKLTSEDRESKPSGKRT